MTAIERLKKLTFAQFYSAAQAGNLAIDAVLADIKDVVELASRAEAAGAAADKGAIGEEASDSLRTALERIERWFGEFPATGQTWSDGSPMSYAAMFGSNGERDFMREVARKALSTREATPLEVEEPSDAEIAKEITDWVDLAGRLNPDFDAGDLYEPEQVTALAARLHTLVAARRIQPDRDGVLEEVAKWHDAEAAVSEATMNSFTPENDPEGIRHRMFGQQLSAHRKSAATVRALKGHK